MQLQSVKVVGVSGHGGLLSIASNRERGVSTKENMGDGRDG